jgi:hypothetical protein
LTSSDLVDETSTAPNAPCTARAVMSIAPSTAAPPTADAAANPTTPISSVFRAPSRPTLPVQLYSGLLIRYGRI